MSILPPLLSFIRRNLKLRIQHRTHTYTREVDVNPATVDPIYSIQIMRVPC